MTMQRHIGFLRSTPSTPALHIAILYALGDRGAKDMKDAISWCEHIRILHEQAEHDFRRRAA